LKKRTGGSQKYKEDMNMKKKTPCAIGGYDIGDAAPGRLYKIPITSTVEVELVQKLDEYVKETGVSKTDVINEALREYLERQEKKN
jgi:hypothetical protein